jgi:hypothetical protein
MGTSRRTAKGSTSSARRRGQRLLTAILLFVTATLGLVHAQTRRAPARRTPAPPALTRIQAQMQCPNELGTGVRTKRLYCDVLTERDPLRGILITIPPHRGPVQLTFELHNRHTYSEELVREKRAFRQYTATIGVLTMDNTLIDRAVIQTEFRTVADLYDRIDGGAGPSGVKAVAPSGSELISIELPDDVGEQVSVLGESLRIRRPDGDDYFTTPGRPMATISNVMLEYRPGPVPRKRP